MILTLLLPLVIYVVSQAAGEDLVQVQPDADATVTAEEKDEDGHKEMTPSPAAQQASLHESSGSSVVVEEGESRVDINIENNADEDSASQPASSLSFSDFQYPGASVLQSSSSQITLTTSEDADAVTNWYEDKIREKDMNVQNFVRTSTNGKVLNKLGAAGGGQEVIVEISAESNSGDTTIVVKSG